MGLARATCGADAALAPAIAEGLVTRGLRVKTDSAGAVALRVSTHLERARVATLSERARCPGSVDG